MPPIHTLIISALVLICLFLAIRGTLAWFSYSDENPVDKRVERMNALWFGAMLAPFTSIPVASLELAWVSVLWCSLYVALCAVATRETLLVTSQRVSRRINPENLWRSIKLRLSFALFGILAPLVSTAAFVFYEDQGIAFLAGVLAALTELIMAFILDQRGSSFFRADWESRGYVVRYHLSPGGRGHCTVHKQQVS